MASVKINVSNKVGDMTVLTFSVAVREQFITMVLRGEEVWDVQETVNVQDARMVHENFILMCTAFSHVNERAIQDVEAGIPLDRDALMQEVSENYAALRSVRNRMVH